MSSRKISTLPYGWGLIRLLVLLIPLSVSSAGDRPDLAGVLISQEIRPFIQMVEGLESGLQKPVCRIFLDDNGIPYSRDPRFTDMDPGRFSVMVAVGPQALSLLMERKWAPPVSYGMILNPERLLPDPKTACGISLNISIWDQLLVIKQTFPNVRRLGVLFDPEKNQAWFNTAKAFLVLKDLNLVPLSVTEQSDILAMFRGRGPDVDAILFIPDQTVISRTIIEFVIKQAVFQRIPTIGYNRFFHESGAAMSFVIDYHAVGEQVANLVENQLAGKPCVSSGPRFKALLNRKVIEKLGVTLGSTLPATVEVDG